MSPDESAVALLHLSAVVSVLTVAYVGIDRAHNGDDPMAAAFDDVKERTVLLVQQLGISETVAASLFSSAKWKSVTTIYPACIMCIVAKVPVKLGMVHTPLFFLYRQLRIPFLKYFRGHLHLLVVGGMAMISTVIFLTTCGMIIWRYELVEQDAFQKISYVVLTSITAWVLLTGIIAIALRPDRLVRLCLDLHRVVNNRLARKLAEAQKTVAAFNNAANGAAGGAPPPAQ